MRLFFKLLLLALISPFCGYVCVVKLFGILFGRNMAKNCDTEMKWVGAKVWLWTIVHNVKVSSAGEFVFADDDACDRTGPD